MKRTTAEANDTNRYTEGNPSLGIPATVVGAEEMNNIQEELCNLVEEAGITLNGADEDQVIEAIGILISRGGVGTQPSMAIANNQVAPASITGLIFDKTDFKGAIVSFDLYRRTATPINVTASGQLFISHNTDLDTWHIAEVSHLDDVGVTFSITAAGQVQYTSTNLSGASYSATMRFTQITKFNQ